MRISDWSSDVCSSDLRRLLMAFRYLRTIAETKPLSDIVATELAPGRAIDTDDEVLDFIRRTTESNYHPCGTARMGSATSRDSVVTPDLRVKGVDGLRVMDASMMPNTTGRAHG